MTPGDWTVHLLVARLRLGPVLMLVSGAVARVVQFVSSPAALLAVLAVAVAIAVGDPRLVGGWLPGVAGSVAVLAGALLVVVWAVKARRQMIVEECVDYTDGKGAVAAKGLATGLTAELVNLANRYREAAGTRGDGGGGANGEDSLSPTLEVGNLASELKNSVSAEATVSIGPVKLPLGGILSLVGALASGPRLLTSLHYDDGELYLLARLQRGSRVFSWRQERGCDDRSGAASRVQDWLGDLAAQIFTDLEVPGTDSWRAVSAFSRGLDAYRSSQDRPQGQLLKLKQAEDHFLKSAAADANYALAYYNLGIVYLSLDLDRDGKAPRNDEEPLRSQTALLKAIEVDPGQLDTYFALAKTTFERGGKDFARETIDLAERASRPDAPTQLRVRALNLMGLASRPENPDPDKPPSAEDFDVRRRCYALAWKALLGRTLAGATISERKLLREELAIAANNLGVIYTLDAVAARGSAEEKKRDRSFARARRLYQEAIRLAPNKSSSYFELGKCLVEQHVGDGNSAHIALAREALQRATAIAPSRSDIWAALALARVTDASPGAPPDHPGAAGALRQALLLPRDSSPQTLGHCSQVLETLPDDRYGQGVGQWRAFLTDVWARVTVPDQLEVLKVEMTEDRPPWERAQIALALAENESDADEWIRLYKCAIEWLQDLHYVELRVRGLRAELAKAYVWGDKLAEALAQAEEAVKRDPLDVSERIVLASVYQAVEEFDLAIETYRQCLALPASKPQEASIHFSIGHAYYAKADVARTLEQRHELAHRAAAAYHDAFMLPSELSPSEITAAHRRLGIVHFIVGESEAALAQLRVARQRQPEWPRTVWMLARVYMMRGAHAQAEAALVEAIESLAGKVAANLAAGQGDHPDSDPDKQHGDPQLLLATMRLDLAASYLLRGANLGEVSRLLDAAQEPVPGVDGVAAQELNGRVVGTRGWLCLERYKQSGDPDQLDEALAKIEQALSCIALGHAYFLLGVALERKAQVDDRGRDNLLSRAADALRRGRGLDPWGEFADTGDELERLLQAQAESEGSNSNGRVGAVSPRATTPA
ncbi:MAG: hypothetical protein M3071_22480 [Actinomycetota bacterium]|nr:hypothetical protein [Actinomycetota bacterium]